MEKSKLIKFETKLKETAAAILIEKKWIPELISRYGDCSVSHEILYRWILGCKHGNKQKEKKFKKLYKNLKHGRTRRNLGYPKDNRGVIPVRIPITEKPRIVERRSRLGDVEVDLMIGKNHKYSLLVMTDIATLHTRFKKLLGKQAQNVKKSHGGDAEKQSISYKTLTFDNDKVFSENLAIGKILGSYTFFTRPYTSKYIGMVENRIGVIRRF